MAGALLRLRVIASLACAAMLIVGLSPAVGAASPPPTTSLISRFDATGAVADQGGVSPSVSGDGRYVAFESRSLLTGEPTGGVAQVFVRDRLTGHTTLVSRASGLHGELANNGSDAPSISADGRYVAFESQATNLVPGFIAVDRTRCDDGTGQAIGDVFLRDLVANTTTLVSHIPGSATTPGNRYSEDPQISSDGSTIVFDSAATDLEASAQPDRMCDPQLFVYKRAADTTITITTEAGTVPNGPVDAYAVSGNGNIVAFVSQATDISPATSANDQAWVRDLSKTTNELVSRASGDTGAVADDGVGGVALNADGSLVAFHSAATNLGVSVPSCPSTPSEPSPGACNQVYLRNRASPATTTLVSAAADGSPGTGDSGPEVISNDGRFVAFETAAPNLGGATAANGNETTQIVVRDVTAATTTLVSRASGEAGAVGGQQSSDVAISSDGQTVAFESTANNLTSDNTLLASQVYVRGAPLGPVPALRLTAAPTIHGTPRVGSALTVTSGSWSPSATSFSYQWKRDGRTVVGATAKTYLVKTSDRGHAISCAVTAHRSGFIDGVATARAIKIL